MKTKNYVQLFCSVLFCSMSLLATAQIDVNSDGNVGVKAEGEDEVSIKIEADGNARNLFSEYYYTGDNAYPFNASFQSHPNTTNIFKGISGYVENSGTGTAFGFYNSAISNSSGSVVGLENRVYGAQQSGQSEKFGIKNYVYGNSSSSTDSDENRIGYFSFITSNGAGQLHGMRNTLAGAGSGGRTGILNYINGTGNGARRGVENQVYGFVDGPYSGSNTKYGMLNYVYGAPTGMADSGEDRVGFYNRTNGDGDGNFRAINNFVAGNGSGEKYGILNSIYSTGSGERIGTYNLVSGEGSGTKKGIQNYVKGGGDGVRYGMLNYVFENGNNDYYGIYNYVFGDNQTNTKYGIYTRVKTENSALAYALYARVEGPGFAGYFLGDVQVVGDFSVNGSVNATVKNFRIDHPLEPKEKDLVFASIEAPEMINMFRGNMTTDAEGFATVILPDYFAAANIDYSYNLTCIGVFAQAIVSEKITGNQFKIQTDQPNVEVSWQVLAKRNDTWAKENPLVVEQDKKKE